MAVRSHVHDPWAATCSPPGLSLRYLFDGSDPSGNSRACPVSSALRAICMSSRASGLATE